MPPDPGSVHIYVLAFANASAASGAGQFIGVMHGYFGRKKEWLQVLLLNAKYAIAFTCCYLGLIYTFKERLESRDPFLHYYSPTNFLSSI